MLDPACIVGRRCAARAGLVRVGRDQFVRECRVACAGLGFVVRRARDQRRAHHARDCRLDLPRGQAGERRPARLAAALPGHDSAHGDIAGRAVDVEIHDPCGPARVAGVRDGVRLGASRRLVGGRERSSRRVHRRAIEREAATGQARRRVAIVRGLRTPGRTFADHPDDLARPRIRRRIEMLQAQRDRIATQRAREFVDERLAREYVRMTRNRVGVRHVDRRVRVPVRERHRRRRGTRRCAGRRDASGVVAIARRRGEPRTVAPGGHPPIGRGLRFDVERRGIARVAGRPAVARTMRAQACIVGGRRIARFERVLRGARVCRQVRITLHRRPADSAPRDAPRERSPDAYRSGTD
ncbi:hypothetical protein FEP45_05697 [Burkholderia multivorans]|nr:hypothetical protein [Burkholderia multivorans]